MPPSHLHVQVPAKVATLAQSIEPVRAFLQGHKIDQRAVRDILLCVHEACVNAIRHSGSDDDIDVRLSLGEGLAHLLVADKGGGLDLSRCDPHRRPSPAESGGRGLYLMACLMDEIEISLDGGTELRMTKRLPPTS